MEMNDMNEKLQFFLEQQIKVHIDLSDGTYLNGTLIKKVKENVWIIFEDKLGNVFVFEKDISKLQQFREDEK